MKRAIKVLILLLVVSVFLTGCNKKYKGYWCNYQETSTIIVLLEKDHTEADKNKVEEKIQSFDNIANISYYTREDYAKELGENVDDMDIYDNFFVLFSSMDSIGTYIEELNEMKGVKEAKQEYAKTNISLYSLENWGKYTYTDSDEATESDKEVGKYKIKKGVITFKPKGENKNTKLLYIKDGYLCGDAECNTIYAESTATCQGKTK